MMHQPPESKILRAVLYARVSSKDQEKEGFSIPAQQRLLREYAATNGIIIAQEFVDVETAKRSGREGFGHMLTFLKKHSGTAILVEKTDRLYRNIKDWATLDEYGVTIHFVKENVIISPDAKSAEMFMHGIRVLMARNYSHNLGEETIKGMTEKARAGIWPSYAPTGYKNIEGSDGKRTITPNEDAPVITMLFELFCTGEYSVKTLATKARADGLTLRCKPIYTSDLHHILRKRLYSGDFDFDGTTYRGTHEPLVTRECWNSVQHILDERGKHQGTAVRRDFPFSGIITCGHCGCGMVAELKKQRYVYYHCTGNRQKCPEPYTRQETLIQGFAVTLSDLVVPGPVIEWLQTELNTTDKVEHDAKAATRERFQNELNRYQARLDRLYEDRLDGTINKAAYDQKAQVIRDQQTAAQAKMTALTEPAVPLGKALDVLRLTSTACQAFLDQPPAEQRKLVRMTIRTATWQDGELRTTLLEPFELLRRSNQSNTNGNNGIGGNGLDFRNWLLR